MTIKKSIQLISATVLLAGFASGTASAGDKKDCNYKKHTTTAQKTETAVSTPTVVLPATAQAGYSAMSKAEKMKKVYTFDEALTLCQKHGATDLQACIDKKTGQTPKS